VKCPRDILQRTQANVELASLDGGEVTLRDAGLGGYLFLRQA
jgi:hypothetical protein